MLKECTTLIYIFKENIISSTLPESNWQEEWWVDFFCEVVFKRVSDPWYTWFCRVNYHNCNKYWQYKLNFLLKAFGESILDKFAQISSHMLPHLWH